MLEHGGEGESEVVTLQLAKTRLNAINRLGNAPEGLRHLPHQAPIHIEPALAALEVLHEAAVCGRVSVVGRNNKMILCY